MRCEETFSHEMWVCDTTTRMRIHRLWVDDRGEMSKALDGTLRHRIHALDRSEIAG